MHKPCLAGIDVSAHILEVALAGPEPGPTRATFDNAPTGHRRLTSGAGGGLTQEAGRECMPVEWPLNDSGTNLKVGTTHGGRSSLRFPRRVAQDPVRQIASLTGLDETGRMVPRAGLEPARPIAANGF